MGQEKWVVSSEPRERAPGLCLLPTLSTGKANQGSELLIMPRDTDTSRESSGTLSMTQVVVLHLLLSISVILTDTRSRRKSLLLQKHAHRTVCLLRKEIPDPHRKRDARRK